MRDYGKVHTSLWSSDNLKGLNSDARLLAVYLLTSPHTTMLGAFRLPDAYACDDLGWSAEQLRNGFETLSSEPVGFVKYDLASRWVWVIKFLRFNRPENPNQWKSVAKLLDAVPSSVPFREEVFETVPKPFRNSPVPAPVSVSVPKKKISAKKTFAEWTDGLVGRAPIPADDKIYDWATATGIPGDWIAVAWWIFEARYGEDSSKQYLDWRAVFRKAVREDWLKAWRYDSRENKWVLTTAGIQAEREMTNV